MGKVVDFLVFVQVLVKVGFAAGTCPENIPIVPVSVNEIMCFKERSNHSNVSLKNFVQEVMVFAIPRF